MSFDPIAYINEPRWLESRLGLDRICELLDRLGRPQDRLKFVHVAGTNGKGSTCAYLASILQAAGLRTGLFTSPYLIAFEERIRVDGANISADDLIEATLLVKEQAEAMADHPTEFELMCAVALVHFARSGCDVVVLEVGLGGRLDSTNVIDAPEVAVIARIGLETPGPRGFGDAPANRIVVDGPTPGAQRLGRLDGERRVRGLVAAEQPRAQVGKAPIGERTQGRPGNPPVHRTRLQEREVGHGQRIARRRSRCLDRRHRLGLLGPRHHSRTRLHDARLLARDGR